MSIKLNLALILFIFLSSLVHAQNERGLLPIKNYTSKDYKALPQNWIAAQDARGVIYFGNNEGLLEFKNEYWKLYQVSNASNILSLSIDSRGYIFVGATDEFGYFAPDKKGKGMLDYYSLANLVPQSKKPFHNIWSVINNGTQTYFASQNQVFFWDRKKLSIIDSPNKIRSLYHFQNKVYAAIDSLGLVSIENGKLIQIQGSMALIDQKTNRIRLRSMTNFGDDKMLMLLGNDSIKIASFQNGELKLTNFIIGFNKGFSNFKANKIVQLKSGLYALSSESGGLLVFDKNGALLKVINKNTGLKTDLINNLFYDNQENLWLALDAGLSRIKIGSAISSFPEEASGYNNTIECIKKFANKIMIGTSSGLYALDKNTESLDVLSQNQTNFASFNLSKFSKLTQSSLQKKIWDLLPLQLGKQTQLLVATDDSIVELLPNGKTNRLIQAYSYCLVQSIKDANRIYIGLAPGLSSLYYLNGKWIDEGRVEGIDFDVRNIAQDSQGNLWLGGVGQVGMLENPFFEKNKIKNPKVAIFDKRHNLTENDAFYTFWWERNLLVASGGGIFYFDVKTQKFQAFKDFGPNYCNPSIAIHRLSADHQGNIWAVRFSPDKEYLIIEKLIKNKTGNFDAKKILVQNREIVHCFYQDINGITWFGGTNGLYRYENFAAVPKDLPFKIYINLVADSLFCGLFYIVNDSISATQTSNFVPVVEYKNNTFSFSFSAIPFEFEHALKYSWYLKGYDIKDKWTPWSEKNEDRFTNLDEGDYTFMVKARDIYGNESNIVSYSFTIKPPWYRTIWAYFGYVIFFLAFVLGAINVSTRGLRKIIKAATAEIQAQKDQLEEKNKNILDSIRYAKRIQEAVIPSDSQLTKVFPDNFVLFRPRDIVSGDFYWMMEKGGKSILAAADCTGHGVPGAFMSIMGISFLNEIANKKEVQTAAEALNQLRNSVITSLNQEGSETEAKDGMDISLCVFDLHHKKLQFAGAYNPLYFIRDGVIDTIKADRMPIGIHERDKDDFTNNELEIKKGDMYYIMSDGYIDQFGGNDGKKFMAKQLKELLLRIHQLPMAEQSKVLESEFIKWRGEIEQIDDVLIIGIRIT